jgi:heat shock protein HslJ
MSPGFVPGGGQPERSRNMRHNPARAALNRAIASAQARGAVTLTNRTPDNMTGAACTLDGKPATITGRCNRFASVATLDLSARAEFSWHACANVLDSGGAFRT